MRIEYNNICIMLPTYGRSTTLLPAFVNSCLATAQYKDILKFAFCVNATDKDTMKYLESVNWPNRGNIMIVTEDIRPPHLAKYYNMLYKATAGHGESCLVTMMGDDMEFKTKQWDLQILRLVNAYNGVGVFWCNDDYIAKDRLCVNMFVTRKMVEATERTFMDETFPADMMDLVWYLVGKKTKSLHYLPNTVIKHNHNTSRPKEQWDRTFNRLRPVQKAAHDMGKALVRERADRIANTLIGKGFIGDNK